MGHSKENQTRFLFKGKSLTVIEIMAITGLKRATIYNRISRAIAKDWKLKDKDVADILEVPLNNYKNLYELNNEFLSLQEIVNRYRLNYSSTQSALNRGDKLENILIRRNLKEKPSSLTEKEVTKLKAAYARITTRTEELNIKPERWCNRRVTFDEVGYPKDKTDFLWIDHRHGELNATTVYWAPDTRRKEYLNLMKETGRHPVEYVIWEEEKFTVAELARLKNIPYVTLLYRIKKGWHKAHWFNPINSTYSRTGPRKANRTKSETPVSV